MVTVQEAVGIARGENGLAVVATLRADSTVQSSVVNSALFTHPETGETVVALVTYGRVKLANLRQRPQITITFRSGWKWATVEGTAELAGPDDPRPWLGEERLRVLLREVFTAAGGQHDGWNEYDRVMAEQRRTIVFIRPTRVYGP
ncbi:TIGR03618 family F420-dependent PPOX class oxidoreductase [Lentzea cavernae]|uniref:PPOX class F420-dependent enzyme n=1 Tax=Lentzea cavernae TaxID=2020703 RepID=A0ABQ3M3W3_9PSEU|nr:TIGR03618 family F420-dependent PPOX class oxidoreductase [Lentzea cavernae]GHH32343.1 PPOX class F420-dependent enzyme [Lentzea cavernae]